MQSARQVAPFGSYQPAFGGGWGGRGFRSFDDSLEPQKSPAPLAFPTLTVSSSHIIYAK